MSEPTPIRAHRRYTKRQKAEAVGVALVEGVTAAGDKTGIAKTTIQEWINKPEYVQLRTTAQEVVAQSLWVGVQIGAKALIEGLQGDAPLHHKASAFEALAERWALLSGEATSRTEHRELTDALDDHEKASLRSILEEALAEVPS